MSLHSILFNNIVNRDNQSRTSSPTLGMPSSLSSSTLRSSNTYWEEDHALPLAQMGRRRDYEYPHLLPADRNLYAVNLSHSINGYGRQSESSSNPSIDFSGLIPMNGESESLYSCGRLLDLSYSNDWPQSNMAHFFTFRQNEPTVWRPDSDRQVSPHQLNWPVSSGGSRAQHFNEHVSSSPYFSASSSTSFPSSYCLPTPHPRPQPTPPLPRWVPSAAPPTQALRKNPRPLCNACGVYLLQRNKLRPQQLIDADIDDDDTAHIPDEEYTG
ncbi:hypothetical protein B0H13DRAFT_2375899 [Mycena leptocephala]|nr:hypothetical protein B0H13DRAFT_2375899 [Mycena leptocephala]